MAEPITWREFEQSIAHISGRERVHRCAVQAVIWLGDWIGSEGDALDALKEIERLTRSEAATDA